MRRRYTARRRDDSVGVDEPCTINAKAVADYLTSQGKPQMAEYVRDIGDHIGRLVAQNNEMAARINELAPPTITSSISPRFTGD